MLGTSSANEISNVNKLFKFNCRRCINDFRADKIVAYKNENIF